jgi:hypothetical protein
MNPTLSLCRHYLSKAAKAAIEFPPYIKEVIIGMILGDAGLNIPAHAKDARINVQQKDLEFDFYFGTSLILLVL